MVIRVLSKLSENPVLYDRSKYIEIKYRFIRDRIQKGAVKLQYVHTDQQVVDILTMPLAKGKRQTWIGAEFLNC